MLDGVVVEVYDLVDADGLGDRFVEDLDRPYDVVELVEDVREDVVEHRARELAGAGLVEPEEAVLLVKSLPGVVEPVLRSRRGVQVDQRTEARVRAPRQGLLEVLQLDPAHIWVPVCDVAHVFVLAVGLLPRPVADGYSYKVEAVPLYLPDVVHGYPSVVVLLEQRLGGLRAQCFAERILIYDAHIAPRVPRPLHGRLKHRRRDERLWHEPAANRDTLDLVQVALRPVCRSQNVTLGAFGVYRHRHERSCQNCGQCNV